MIRQHNAPRTDADFFRAAGDVADQHRRCRAGDTFYIMMLRQPIAVIAPLLGAVR